MKTNWKPDKNVSEWIDIAISESMRYNASEIVAKIIRMYASSRYSVKTRGEFDAWFSSDVHLGEKDKAFEELWQENVGIEEDPGRETEKAFRKLSARLGMAPAEAVKEKRTKRRVRVTLGGRVGNRIAAAIAVLIVCGGALLLMNRGNKGVEADIFPQIRVTAWEYPRMIILPDSSRAWINVKSTLTYTSGFRDGRRMELDGEAYFEVKKDASRPFSVHTDKMDVTVLGTAFNVQDFAQGKQGRVSLYSGGVRVEFDGKSRELTAGKELTYVPAAGELKIEEIEVYEHNTRKPHWLAQPIDLRYSRMSEIFSAIGESYGVTIGDLPPGIPQYVLSLYLDGTETLEEALFRVWSLSGKRFKYEIRGDSVIIRR